MPKTIKCKSCKTVNDKYAKQCRSCGTLLYPEISHKKAELITIILDAIFFIYKPVNIYRQRKVMKNIP